MATMIIVMEAVIAFAHRYADLADELADKSDDDVRRAELKTMAMNADAFPNFRQKHFFRGFSWYGLIIWPFPLKPQEGIIVWEDSTSTCIRSMKKKLRMVWMKNILQR